MIEVLFAHPHDELVKILSPKYAEVNLASLVRDAVSTLCSKHHLAAVHIVVNAVLKWRYACIFVDLVEIYQSLRRYLNLGISFDVVDEATILDLVVFFPFIRYVVVVVPLRYPLKEEDLIGAVSH